MLEEEEKDKDSLTRALRTTGESCGGDRGEPRFLETERRMRRKMKREGEHCDSGERQ